MRDRLHNLGPWVNQRTNLAAIVKWLDANEGPWLVSDVAAGSGLPMRVADSCLRRLEDRRMLRRYKVPIKYHLPRPTGGFVSGGATRMKWLYSMADAA